MINTCLHRRTPTRRKHPAILAVSAAALVALCVAPQGAHAQNIWVGQYGNGTVGEYNATTGATINASLVSGVYPYGLAVSGNTLFLAPYSPSATVTTYNATTGAVINASLVTGVYDTGSLTVSGNNLFVADYHGTVGEYNASTGATINANFITGLSYPSAMQVVGNNLYVADYYLKTVGLYNATTGAVINANLVTGLNYPWGVTVSGNNLFVANVSGDSVGKYNATTGAVINASFITGLSSPYYIAVVGNDLLVANYGNSTVSEYDATTGALINASFISAPGAWLLSVPNFTGPTTGPLLQNSAPVGVPTTADFLVNGPVQTGGGNNMVNTLTFLPGSSLHIYNNLFVTLGPVILVDGSSITLDGSLTVNQLQLLFGSLLNGNGSILGDLINAGLLSPGHSPGQIQVSGNYTQTSTGTLRIEIAGRDLARHDLLSVGGRANLDGTLQLVPLNGFKLKRNKPVTFLTAAGGVFGKFATVENGFTSDTILEPTVVYHSNSVALEAVQGSFEQFALGWGLTPNQKSVARALDSAAGDHRTNSLFDYLDNRKLTSLPGDFDKIAPEELTSMFTIGVSLANVQSGNIQRRTDDIRSGTSGFSAAGLAVNGTGPSYSGGFGITTGVAGPNGTDDGKEVKENKAVIPAENRWGVFLSGTGEWVSVGNTDNARGYDLTSGGFTLGIDYKVTPNFAIGLAAGYTGTSADLVDRGRVYVNGGKIGLYATFFQNEQAAAAPTMSKDSSKDSSKEAPAPAPSIAKGFYADMAVFGGYNSYDTRRSALQGEARGDTDGSELNALFGAGYDFKAGGLTFGPTASFNYTYLGTNDFTEHGSLAPLNIHGGKGESLRTAFGIKASYDWKVGGILIKPEIRAAWQHEYGDAAYALDSSFANGAGGTFTVNGPQLGRDSALLGAGFAIQCSERCSTYFYYDGELGRTNYQSTSVTGGFRYAF
ncbi:MAG: autotransporter domain-containing protein [Chthoniobacter sp.]|nr:autotransporter domain-containing protein [Chthoniobacter sp.]